MKALHSGYGPRADFCWQQDHTALGHPPVLTAASDAALLVTFSRTNTTACGPWKFIQMILIQRKKNEAFLFLTKLFSVICFFPHSQGRGGTALLLGWKWMAGSGQKLIKLALAKDMNCGITPWIASNPISLAQLVMRSGDEFQPARKHSSWTFTRKSIHWTLRFLLKFYWIFTQGSTFPTRPVCLNFSIWIPLTEQFCHL